MDRIKRSISRHHNRFLERILSEQERQKAPGYPLPEENPEIPSALLTFAAGRFAAKEACVKALGTGFRHGISFQDITVLNDELGAPLLTLQGEAQNRATSLNAKGIHLTITHTEKTAAAVVILEK
jgi:holo-[acyl-carrier protein] synthase